jgi:hypothetical protein
LKRAKGISWTFWTCSVSNIQLLGTVVGSVSAWWRAI